MRIQSRNYCPQAPHRAASGRAFGLALLFFVGALGAVSACGLVACGGGASAQPVAPVAPVGPPPSVPSGTADAGASASAPAAVDPFALPASPRDDETAPPASLAALDLEPWRRAAKAKGVAPSPPSCAAYAKRAPRRAPSEEASEALDRAQRADLAPVECADAIVDPLLLRTSASPSPSASPSSRENAANMRLLVGFSLAGKLARTASAPPAMGAIREKEKVKAFVTGPLKSWLVEQSTAIELLSSGAAGLEGYARGIAAVEAGIAELRLVDQMRSAPVPATWDPELRSIYEAALDEALEPRKKRGRDAALVGMSDFARIGIVRDPRVARARALLSKLYGGRRIDALDALLLPAIAVPPLSTPHDAALEKLPEGATGDLRSAYVRARFDMGRVYWRRVDFVEAAHAARPSPKPEDRLLLALSLALARGPNGAAEMMRAPSPAALGLGHTEALDALVAEGGPLAGVAAYDAAHLRSLSPPEGADAAPYLKDVAARFRKAETLLGDPEQKKAATQRAAEIDAIVTSAK